MGNEGETDRRVLILNAEDNVGVACCDLAAGIELAVRGATVCLPGDVTLGHKLALRPLKVGDKIVKWGAPIGSATETVAAGGHVHLHNMQSDYIPTYTFEEGHQYVRGDGR